MGFGCGYLSYKYAEEASMPVTYWILAFMLATISSSNAAHQATAQPPQPVTQTFVVTFNANQSAGYFELPVKSAQGLQVVAMTAQAVNAATGIVVDGIATALEGNGIVVLASASGKLDVVLRPGSAIRISSYRTKPSAIPIRVNGTITTQLRP
jgi:hypothetical protein